MLSDITHAFCNDILMANPIDDCVRCLLDLNTSIVAIGQDDLVNLAWYMKLPLKIISHRRMNIAKQEQTG